MYTNLRLSAKRFMERDNRTFQIMFHKIYFGLDSVDAFKQAAVDFGVSKWTVQRWYNGEVKAPHVVMRLFEIVRRGFLPDDERWMDFRIDVARGIFITPNGRVFKPSELEAFSYHIQRYETLEKLFGDQLKSEDVIPRSDLTNPLPHRGGPFSTSYPNVKRRYNYIMYSVTEDDEELLDELREMHKEARFRRQCKREENKIPRNAATQKIKRKVND